jgi:excisionase family DNA binding protein
MSVGYLSVAEVAKRLRVSHMTIYRLVQNGEMDSIRVGRSFRIPESGYERYLVEHSGTREPAQVAS